MEMQRAVKKIISDPQEPSLQILMEGFVNSQWLLKDNILEMLTFRPISFDELEDIMNDEEEIDVEPVIRKITFLAVAFYCMSTEKRFEEDKRQQENFRHHSAISES